MNLDTGEVVLDLGSIRATALLERVRGLSEGDLQDDCSVTGSDYLGQLGSAVQQTIDRMRRTLSIFDDTAKMVVAASEESGGYSQTLVEVTTTTATKAQTVAISSEQVNRNVAFVASGSHEMVSSIAEISQSAADATQMASLAVRIVEQANAGVAQLGQSGLDIGKVVKSITSIAQQTNFLALNAAIEAARAGAAGRGFAVVANEVKELAKETALATQEITRKIEAIQADTRGAVEAIGKIGTVISQVNDISATIAVAVKEQTATTNNIGRNLADASHGATEIAAGIGQLAEAISHGTQSAADAKLATDMLRDLGLELAEHVNTYHR
jgi:methyl-accepting chemotaxis protein